MNNQQTNEKLSPGIRKVSSIDLLDDEGKNTAIDKILQTREARKIIADILSTFLNASAGDSRIKKIIMKVMGSYINKFFYRPEDIFDPEELKFLFEDEQFIKNITQPMPELINDFFDAVITMTSTIERLPSDEKKEILHYLSSSMATGQLGQFINGCTRIMNSIHKDDPEFITKALTPGLKEMINNADFGELKNFINGMVNDLTSLVKAANGTMFDNPAKVVLSLSFFPSIANMLIKIIEDIVVRFNEFPPDLVADVILSLLRDVDAKTLGVLSNNAMELIRKIHVGSALIGDPGMPQSRLDITRLIEKYTAELDVELLWKFNEILAQSKEQFDLSMLNVLKNRPELVIKRLQNASKLKNYRVKSANEKLAMLENMPEKETFDALSEGVSKLDTNLMAEWINLSTLLLNRLNNSNPDLLSEMADEFISTLDLYELEDTMKWAVENFKEPLKPLGEILVPSLIKMAADWISTDEHEQDEELEQAKKTIIQFLNNKEVAA